MFHAQTYCVVSFNQGSTDVILVYQYPAEMFGMQLGRIVDY